MPVHTFLLAIVVALSTQQSPAALTNALKGAIAESGAEVAVAVRTLDGRLEVLIDADQSVHAASTMKVPVMIELFRQAEAAKLSLDDPLPVRNQFRSIVDGSPYALSEGDDSDTEGHAAVGRTMTLRQLCEAMITVSSNFAANLLIESKHVGKPNNGLLATLPGANGMGQYYLGFTPEATQDIMINPPKVLIVAQADLLYDDPTTPEWLDKVETIISLDLFPTSTVERAAVALPIQSFAERDGSFVNGERRVQRDFHDGRREALDAMHGRDELRGQFAEESLARRGVLRLAPCQHA